MHCAASSGRASTPSLLALFAFSRCLFALGGKLIIDPALDL
jgi:hypothetical protein